jgi:hypothetical protein
MSLDKKRDGETECKICTTGEYTRALILYACLDVLSIFLVVFSSGCTWSEPAGLPDNINGNCD